MPGHESKRNTGAQGRRRMIVVMLGTLVIAALTAVLMRTTAAHTGANASLTVTLGGVAGNKGKVLAALCDKATFLKRCAHASMGEAEPGATLHFTGLAPGAYAVMVFHDENGNGEFDQSANGMPREGYGFSRNARGHYGPPTFEDAAIDLKPGTATINIDLSY